ncbi:MAG TPA: DDE-type integrase/transposase/recombinase [Myxococcota bacterium]
MSTRDSDHRHAVALFRYGVIAELVRLEPGAEGLYRQIAEKAERDYVIPGTPRTRVAAETIRHWLKRYRAGGFDALVPKPRADRGRPRKIPDDVAELLIAIKEAHPELPVRGVIEQARSDGQLPEALVLAPSTVNRLLAREGLMRPRPEAGSSNDRRRFAFERAGQLWMSDVMHGPAVAVEGRARRKSYLIAFLDDATRVVPYAAFALSENTAAFLPVFKQALLRRGLPERLYVDNGANFRSQHLALVCAKLGVALIHARPYQPQGKGKLERWFRTVRAQLLARLVPGDTASLEALNRRLWAYVEGEYHQAPHRSLGGETPLERWASVGRDVQYAEPGLDLDALFLFETTRRVQRDRTVSLAGVVYEVDAALIGEKVTLRYDPAAPPGRPLEVWYEHRRLADATPLDAYANCFVKRHRPSSTLLPDRPAPPPKAGLALRELKRRGEPGDDGEGR